MRETLAVLLMLGIVTAVSAYNQQRSCATQTALPPESSATDEDDRWIGESAAFQKAIWRLYR